MVKAIDKPKTTDKTDRDAKGRFIKGNKAATGGPGSASTTTTKLKHCFQQNVTEEDIKDVIAKHLELAKRGDMSAIKELYDRLFGKPLQRYEGDTEVRVYTDEQCDNIRKMLAVRIFDANEPAKIA
ncbi:MAG: hypothetical protein PVF17_12190 [Ignavibacteria bacterium]|jgi:hypothetical protein